MKSSLSSIVQSKVLWITLTALCIVVGWGTVVNAQVSFSLEPSQATYQPNESVTIDWSAPSDRAPRSGWIGIYEPDESDGRYETWQWISSSRNSGERTFTNLDPGTYEARLFSGGGYDRVAVSDSFTVRSTAPPPDDDDPDDSGYALESVADEYTSNERITIEWSAPVNRAPRSGWIGIYEPGARNSSYEAWEWIESSQNSGAVTFDSESPGTYEARFFSGSGYTLEERSSTFVISSATSPPDDDDGDDGEYVIQSSKATYQPNEAVVIEWSAPSDRAPRSGWIGIYEPDESDGRYETWQWISSSQNSGERTFTNLDPGTYEARLFSGSGYTLEDRSSAFVVSSTTPPPDDGDDDDYDLTVSPTTVALGDSVTVTFTAPASSNRRSDWIGVYEPGASATAYQAWRYTGGDSSGSLTFTMDRVGTYEFRYYKNNGYTERARSEAVTVSGGAAQCPVSDRSSITNYPAAANEPIVAFGDSLTEGVGASAGEDYVSQLERRAGVPIINAGVSGDTTRDALARVDSDVLSRNPEIVIVWLGGNDILERYYERIQEGAGNVTLLESLRVILLRITGKLPEPSGISEDETFANLTEIVTEIQADGAIVLLLGFSGGVFDSALEGRYQEVAEDTGALYVPNVLRNVIGRPSRMSDLVHPNDIGYGIVADRVYERLVCVLPE